MRPGTMRVVIIVGLIGIMTGLAWATNRDMTTGFRVAGALGIVVGVTLIIAILTKWFRMSS